MEYCIVLQDYLLTTTIIDMYTPSSVDLFLLSLDGGGGGGGLVVVVVVEKIDEVVEEVVVVEEEVLSLVIRLYHHHHTRFVYHTFVESAVYNVIQYVY